MFFVAFKVWITINIINYKCMVLHCWWKVIKIWRFLGEKYKNRDKLIQFGTPWQHTKNRDYSGKIVTAGMFAKTSNNKHDWNPVKYLNVLHHNRTQKQLLYFFLIHFENLTDFLCGFFGHVWLLSSKIDKLHQKSKTPFITCF